VHRQILDLPKRLVDFQLFERQDLYENFSIHTHSEGQETGAIAPAPENACKKI
jgi:hypothetical protein